MESIVVDLETYWDSEYTLRKMTTVEYVTDVRFQMLGGVICRESENFERRFYRADMVESALRALPWDDMEFVAHHARFDASVCAFRLGLFPKRYACTESRARFWHLGELSHYSLDALAKHHNLQGKFGGPLKDRRAESLSEQEWLELERYTLQDGALGVWMHLQYKDLIPESEKDIQDLTIRFYTEPRLLLDKPLLEQVLAEALAKKGAALVKGGVELEALRSAPKFAGLLTYLGVEPPTKISKKTGKRTFAFARKDVAFVELQDHHDVRVRDLVEARLEATSNLVASRAQRLITMHDCLGGKYAVPLNCSAARTHRWGGTEKINDQNHTRGSKLAKVPRAPPGYVQASADLAQIEARLLATLAGQHDLVEDFRNGVDVYAKFASTAYGFEVTKKTHPLERFVGKTCRLGLGFQTGAAKLQNSLRTGDPPVDLPFERCYELVQIYRMTDYMIPRFWESAEYWMTRLQCEKQAFQEGPLVFDPERSRVWLPNQTSLHYPGLDMQAGMYHDGDGLVTIYGGKATENFVQALARVHFADCLLKLREICRVVSCRHDAAVMLWPQDQIETLSEQTTRIMTTPPSWMPDIPLAVEIELDTRSVL